MTNFMFTALLLLVMLAGCASRNGTGLVPSNSTSDSTSDLSREDLKTVIQGLGIPIPFDQVFAEVQGIPRFKGEFETTDQFEQRQAVARTKCKDRYLIAVQVDPERIRYDADQQILHVSIYALKNTGPTDDELNALFGFGSELRNANVDIQYGTSIWKNVDWAFPRDRQDIGIYVGQNTFGVRKKILKQAVTARGIFERKGAQGGDILDGEDVWFRRQPKYKKGFTPEAFTIKADPTLAWSLKQSGALRAGVVVAPRFPFYATGVVRDTPTIQSPFDRTINVQYVIGDIQGVALYDSAGALLAVRETR